MHYPMVKLYSHHHIACLYFYLNNMTNISSIKKLDSEEKIILDGLVEDLKDILRTGQVVFYLLGEELEVLSQVLEEERGVISLLSDGPVLIWILNAIHTQLNHDR